MRKKLVLTMLALFLMLMILPMGVLAAEVESGTCGENLTWTLENETLTISGTGAMTDYDWNYHGNGEGNPPYFHSNIKKVVIQNGVTSIGDGAFAEQSALSSIEIPNSVTSIGDDAFFMCYDLSSIEIPDSVTSIGDGAFVRCSSLTSIKIPNSVISIRDGAFAQCWNLSNVELSDSVTSIGDGVFFECRKMVSIKIPKSVTSIGVQAFWSCSNMTSIEFPNSVTSIGDYAFESCSSLREVYYGGSENDWVFIDMGAYNDSLLNASIHYRSPLDSKIYHYYDTIAKSSVDVDLEWRWNDLLKAKENSYKYNAYLAQMGVILSAAIEGSVADIENILSNHDKLGCEKYGFKETSPAMAVGMKLIKNGGKTKHIIFVVLRGTTTDTDKKNDAYSALKKANWGNEDVYFYLNYYLEEWSKSYKINKDNTKFFITGHSLGGACANFLSEKLSKEYGTENVFGYTFAAPSPIRDEEELETSGAGHYDNIFNFLCVQDSVPTYFNSRNKWYGYGWPKWFNMYELPYKTTEEYFRITGKQWEHTYNENKGLLGCLLHAPSIYMAYLKTDPDLDYTTTTYDYACVACPVDVEVYNSKNELVGRIVNDEIDNSHDTPEVKLIVSDGTKYVYFLNDDTYTLKFIGNGDGTMSYTAATRDMSSETDKESIVYSNVKISPGKKFESVVSSYDETNTDNSIAISDVKLVVTDDSGNAVSQVMSDAAASSSGKDNGTEVPVKSPDSPGIEPDALPFADVNQADWYYDPAKFVFSRKIMTGMDDTHFGPGGILSRAQFATILYRMEGSPKTAYNAGAFPDVVDGEFFTSPAMWAKSTGVITGYANGNFGPADDITREQMAVMMYRYAGMRKLDTSVRGDLGSFPDGSSVSGFAQEAMAWAVGKELIRGDNGKLNPQGKAERGQCATIIMRYMQGYGL